jgi:hypothetical protein
MDVCVELRKGVTQVGVVAVPRPDLDAVDVVTMGGRREVEVRVRDGYACHRRAKHYYRDG